MSKIVKTCLECNKEFSVFNYRKNSLYCSISCYRKNIETKKISTCRFCNKEFTYRPVSNNGSFCSELHRLEFYKHTKNANICKQCGKEFNTIRSRNNANYCSWKCYSSVAPMLKCEECGKEFKRRTTKRPNKYCSRLCFNKNYRKVFGTHKTKPEIIIEDIIRKNNMDYKYVGDGSFWISVRYNNNDININPDFINTNGEKKIIEVFGDYWHRRKEVLTKDSIKDLALKELGWKRIVIWECDVYKKTEKEILKVINEK